MVIVICQCLFALLSQGLFLMIQYKGKVTSMQWCIQKIQYNWELTRRVLQLSGKEMPSQIYKCKSSSSSSEFQSCYCDWKDTENSS